MVFLVLEILPGNAAQILMGPDASPDAVRALATKLGIDRPPLERYWALGGGPAHRRPGRRATPTARPCRELVLERLALTVPLAVMAMALTAAIALAAGIYAAARHNKLGDVGVMGLSQVGIAIPNFWFAILLILLFSVHLQWFSAGGFPGWERRRAARPARPAAARDLAGRGAVGDPGAHHALGGARRAARGLRAHRPRQGRVASARTLWGHVLRNAMIPVVTVMGLQFAELLAGTIVVESVFYLPGLGRLIFQSISNRDLIVVRNCVMLLAAMVVIVNFVVDLLYAAIDPRVKASDI